MSSNIFERLCLRFKADDGAAAMKEPMMYSVTVDEVDEVLPAVVAPHAPVAHDSSKVGEQICISTGMS
jgi:hypothetical protein